jgi:uracil-DNA glycosylase
MATSTINVADIKEKLYLRLKPSGWADQLKGFILSADFDRIIEKLMDITEDGKRFTPPLKTVFRPFEECHYDDLKVVLLDSIPFCELGEADGLAYSNLKSRPGKTIRLLEEAKKGYLEPKYDFDLTPWSKQGVLLLNTSMTTQVGKQVSHEKIWDHFICYLFDIIDKKRAGVVFIFPGEDTQKYHRLIGPKHHKYLIDDPNSPDFDAQDVFAEANRIWLEKGGIINW